MVTATRVPVVESPDPAPRLAGLGLIDSVEPFRRSSLRSDLERIGSFFGIRPTSTVMIRLTGCTKAVLSRAQTDSSEAVRAAEHIAVLAALTIEMERFYGSERSEPAAMRRWLYAGRLIAHGGPLRPIDALADPEVAQAALQEVREARLSLSGED